MKCAFLRDERAKLQQTFSQELWWILFSQPDDFLHFDNSANQRQLFFLWLFWQLGQSVFYFIGMWPALAVGILKEKTQPSILLTTNKYLLGKSIDLKQFFSVNYAKKKKAIVLLERNTCSPDYLLLCIWVPTKNNKFNLSARTVAFKCFFCRRFYIFIENGYIFEIISIKCSKIK